MGWRYRGVVRGRERESGLKRFEERESRLREITEEDVKESERESFLEI